VEQVEPGAAVETVARKGLENAAKNEAAQTVLGTAGMGPAESATRDPQRRTLGMHVGSKR